MFMWISVSRMESICGKILTVSGTVWRLHGMAAGAVLQPDYNESAVQPRAGYPAYPASLFPAASGWRAGCRLSQRATPAGEAVTVFLTSARSCRAARLLIPMFRR